MMQKQDVDGGITASVCSPWQEKKIIGRELFQSSVLLSGRNINIQHCITPVCILFNQTRRGDAERFLFKWQWKKPWNLSGNNSTGKLPQQIQDQRQWGFSYPQWKESKKEKKMVLLFPTGRNRASDPITRLATSYLQKQSWLVGSIHWNSFIFCHRTEMVKKKKIEIRITHTEQVPACP